MADQVGRYRLEGVVGVGSFATVHRAVDTRLDDVVVVKMLAENHTLNPEVRERFIAEGRALRKIDSPHVIAIHDIGESERQQPYLVLQHADRGTLAARVAQLRTGGWGPTRQDVLVVSRSLAAAVEAVHRAGLVHRDLSPGNVLLTTAPGSPAGAGDGDQAPVAAVVAPGERLVVADLGMCKDLARNSGLTVAGGTAGFRPPEQDGPGRIDTRADLWAMSALLLWLCDQGTGATDLPAALFTALRRSVAADPADRHPDVASWLADIEAAMVPPAAPGGRMLTPPAAMGRRNRSIALLLVVVLVVVLAGGLGWFGGSLWSDGSTDRAGRAGIAITGPESIAVGQQAQFTAATEEVDTWVWVLPTGQYVLDAPQVTLTPTAPGYASLVLRAHAPDGTELEAVHRITVDQ